MNILLSLCLAMLVGLLMTRLVKLVGLPNVTGYLIAGLIVGRFCFGWVAGENLAGLEILTDLALGFIAFSIGGEFKLDHIRAIGASAITITFFQAFGAVLVVGGALLICGFELPLVLMLAAIATATAPAATLLVVRQYKAHGPVTSTLLPVVALDDMIGLIVFAVCNSLSVTLATGSALTVQSVLLEPLREIGLSLVVGAAIGGLLALSMRFFKSRANRICLILCCVVGGVALSQILGLSNLLVCMMIGALFANLRDDSPAIMENCDRWTPPLFMLFFVISGAELDLAAVPGIGLIGVVYLLARSAGKYFGARLGATVTKAEPNVRRYLGITLLPQAGVAVGMAQMAVNELPAVYGTQIQTVVLCATLIYELVGPVLTKIALTRAGEIEKPAKAPKTPKPAANP